MVHRIVFHFHEDGTVTTDASGFRGGQCTRSTEQILAGLNAKIKKRILKPEYSQEAAVIIKEHCEG